MRLEGKVALITGAGSGLGRATAVRFAKEGATVAIMGRHEKILEELISELMSHGGDGLVVSGDVSKVEDCNKVAEKVFKAYGALNILVNNAGIIRRTQCADTSDEDWWALIGTNLAGPFFMCRACIPYMLRSRGGSIINIASAVGLVGTHNLSAYCASKSGLITFTKSIAIDYGKKGIRANTICPAYIETDLNRDHLNRLRQDPEKWKRVMDAHPIGRIGIPDDVANAALFLASDEASWITGIDLPVDGGYLAQ
jgi:NAD(P)-dependent dehydrogenase (short-subunit alcohol dehydrogenase family)